MDEYRQLTLMIMAKIAVMQTHLFFHDKEKADKEFENIVKWLKDNYTVTRKTVVPGAKA
jgi:hypothetical protein